MQTGLSTYNTTNFCGVIPVKVHIDGKEAVDSINIQKGCRKLIEGYGKAKNSKDFCALRQRL